MSDHKLRRASDPLGARLRHEADLTRPEFSAELHDRFREAIAREMAEPLPPQPLSRLRERGRGEGGLPLSD